LLGSILDKLNELLGELNQAIFLSETFPKVLPDSTYILTSSVRRIKVVLLHEFFVKG
jgi:hypothetical protein